MQLGFEYATKAITSKQTDSSTKSFTQKPEYFCLYQQQTYNFSLKIN